MTLRFVNLVTRLKQSSSIHVCLCNICKHLRHLQLASNKRPTTITISWGGVLVFSYFHVFRLSTMVCASQWCCLTLRVRNAGGVAAAKLQNFLVEAPKSVKKFWLDFWNFRTPNNTFTAFTIYNITISPLYYCDIVLFKPKLNSPEKKIVH